MSGYLDNYGAVDERRERTRGRILKWGAAALAVAGILYFVFHFVIPNRGERSEAARFFQLLAVRDYKQAYAMWGCTDAKPCRDYPFDSFMQDWGPEATPVTTFEVLDGESCGSGVIVDVDTGKAGDRKIWVERQDHILGSMPPGYDRCPHSNRIYNFVRDLRYRIHGKTFK
jgi:hypothetical protein